LEGYRWKNDLSYEYRQKNFTIIDPYRSVEFERNWSGNVPVTIIPQDNALTDDHLVDFRTQLLKDNDNHLKYHFSRRDKGVALEGIQNTLEVAQQVGQLQIDADAFLLNSRQYDLQSDWKRMRVDAHWQTHSVMPGYVYRFDRNAVRKKHTDSVQYSAINFEEHQFYLQSSDSLSGNFRVDYSFRTDQSPYLGNLVKSDQSHTANARYNAHIYKDHQLGILFTYRTLQILNDSVRAENQRNNSEEESILGKMSWSGSFLKSSIRSS
jgi:hypothetical protein